MVRICMPLHKLLPGFAALTSGLTCLVVLIGTASAQGDNNGFALVDRWQETATDGGGIDRGDAITLTWSIVPDGTFIDGFGGEAPSDSDLISFLDGIIGAGPGGSDLTQRPWFEILDDGYGRWGEVSGLSILYEANDDGVDLASADGALGVRGDFRVSGHSIDGQSGSNTLAYNFFPSSGGDQVIDTDNSNFYSTADNDYRGFRNVISHEAGHGLGLAHITSSSNDFLMEPFVDTSFDGPQFSDILGMHRGYGDINERNGGNDLIGNATDLGTLSGGESFLIGEDAVDAVIARTDIDFVSIDGDTDTDFFSFTLTSAGDILLELTPVGPTYQVSTAGGDWDAAAQNDLSLTLLDSDGTTILDFSDSGSFGQSESISRFLTSGTYFAQVSGSNDGAQFFQFYGSFSAVPEPGSTVALLGLAAVLTLRRRQRGS